MGDRNNIILNFGKAGLDEDEEDRLIYLYSHWSGSSMAADLQNALKRGVSRWDDAAYLARIIFSELIRDDILGETGYGIAPYQCDQDGGNVALMVDLEKQTVNGVPYKEFVAMDEGDRDLRDLVTSGRKKRDGR